MTVLWSDMTARFDTLLSDAVTSDQPVQQYSPDLRMLAFNMAQEYFAITHTAIVNTVSATASGYGPDIVLVFDQAGSMQAPGMIPPPASPVYIRSDIGWLEPQIVTPGELFPMGGYTPYDDCIVMWDTATTTVRVTYYKLYNEIVSSSTVVNVPKWSLTALTFLAHIFLLDPTMMSQANLRQFQTKREAGSPEDNPPRSQARYYWNLYHDLVKNILPQDRQVLYRQGGR